MALKDMILPEFDHEMANTRKQATHQEASDGQVLLMLLCSPSKHFRRA